MQAPLPLPDVFKRTERLEALENWRGEVDGRIGYVEVQFNRLRQGFTKLHDAVKASQDVRKACKESVGNLERSMQREITNLKEEIARKAYLATVGNLERSMQRKIDRLKEEIDQMKGVVDDDDVSYVKTVPAKSPGLRLKL